MKMTITYTVGNDSNTTNFGMGACEKALLEDFACFLHMGGNTVNVDRMILLESVKFSNRLINQAIW